MRLDAYLVEQYHYTRSRAQLLIHDGSVLINDIVATKPNKTVQQHDKVVVIDTIKYVSRAGLKLAFALEHFHIDPSGLVCLDVGSSTGGFTHCLLENNAEHIDAVDVGTDQLVDMIKNNPRVSTYEKTDIRSFITTRKYDLIVCDASFISLTKLIPSFETFCKEGTQLIILIKPQFEVGKDFLGKGGIVSSDEAVVRALDIVVKTAGEHHMTLMRPVAPCTVLGGDGNQEYVAYFTYQKKTV